MNSPLSTRHYDAVVVGAGPNGLAAAITLARAGKSLLLVEGRQKVGGGCRSAELTLPGFTHDVCSAIHPLGVGSPFFESLPLAEHSLVWIHPPAPLAHPLDDGTAIVLERSIEATSANLGADGSAYLKLMTPLVDDWDKIERTVLGPPRLPVNHPFLLARFGLQAIMPAASLAKRLFRGQRARALFAGLAAHSMLPLERAPSAGFGLVLGALAHAVGWPVARGGSQHIANALASYLGSLGGEIVTGFAVRDLSQLPAARVVMLDLTPRQLLRIAGRRLSLIYRQQLRHYRYGPGVFKLDLALDGPIPWTAPECSRAGTVHLGGTFEEIAASERALWDGKPPERPFVLLGQQSLFDSTRAPQGKHTVWAYCHVPRGSTLDMTERIEAQIERFAPGFRERVLARHGMTACDMESYNPNYIGGDINGGVQDLRQLFTRPVPRLVPYRTSARGIYLCSSSTPPGGGVHGMCGYHAGMAALRDL